MLQRFLRLARCISVLSCLFCLLPLQKTYATDYPTLRGVVHTISDGDTINMSLYDDDGNLTEDRITLRFLHVDTPELHLPGKGNKGRYAQGHWGQDAKNALMDMLPLYGNIRIEDHGVEHWGRTLATLYYDNLNVNLALVKQGWAYPYILCNGECSEEYFKEEKITSYFKACRQARDAGLGVWNNEKPLLEYPFEFRLRIQGRTPDKYMGDYTTGDLYPVGVYDQVDICNAVFFYSLEEAEALGFTLRN